MPEVTGRVAIVTGANSGIGFGAARALVARGGRVVMACRSLERGGAALDEIRADHPGGEVELMELDLADLSSVRRFAEVFLEGHDHLHLLINNAGVMLVPELQRTAEGFELQFGTNHLGHFALTGLLLDTLTRTPQSRVVTLTSFGHIFGRIDFDNLNAEKSYSSIGAYAMSKLANLLFTYELQRRLESEDAGSMSVASHPGWSATNLLGHMSFFQLFTNLVAMRPAKGVLSTLYAATDPEVKGGTCFGPRGFLGVWGYPKQVKTSRRSHDRAVAERLWGISEELTGVRFRWPGDEG